MSLAEYKRKRDFSVTSEPVGGKRQRSSGRRFVIQKHDASRLHYDFRLELGGTLVSWAVPKGMPMAKGEKHLAIKVEDHPLSYIDFEGAIPEGQYGGGTVQVWDCGTYEPLSKAPIKELKGGKLHVILHGKKLTGEWYLVRLRDEDQWLMVRGGADHKKLGKQTDLRSALSGKTMAQLAKSDHVWSSGPQAAKNERGTPTSKRKPASSSVAKRKPAAQGRKRAMKGKFIPPMLARLEDHVPPGEWQFEIKFDGFRALAFKEGKTVHLLSRTNHDLGEKFPEIAEALLELRAKDAVVDGEIVALDKKGRSSFQLLQAYELGRERPPLYYYAFDLLVLKGKSMQRLPLEERRGKLRDILPDASSVVRFSSSLGSDAEKLLAKARKLGLEGLIGKRSGSAYESARRSGAWIKLKLAVEQEFVIGGFTEPSGARQHLGALLVGVYKKGKLTYAGKVGTGFNEATLRDLHRRFKAHARATCPFTDLPEARVGRYGQGITAAVMKKCHWMAPKLVCQVKFSEWTRDGRLRQPVYLGLREDKKPREIIREPQSHLP